MVNGLHHQNKQMFVIDSSVNQTYLLCLGLLSILKLEYPGVMTVNQSSVNGSLPPVYFQDFILGDILSAKNGVSMESGTWPEVCRVADPP